MQSSVILKENDRTSHLLQRCVICETQAYGRFLSMKDFDHVDELCVQFYFDSLGHGFNTKEIKGFKKF